MVHSVNSQGYFLKNQWFFIIRNTLKGFLSKPLELSVLHMSGITAIVLGWIQLNNPCHFMVCLMALDDSQLPFMLSCWCSMQRVNTFFFSSPIYLTLDEQSNWHTPGWQLGSSFGSFWHRIVCISLLDVKIMFLFIVLNSLIIFGPILGTHRSKLRN